MGNLISCICPTFNRPKLLGRAIACFEKQTYENRYLTIIDDLGQYDHQKGDRWQIISFSQRVLSLGEKNNMCAALSPRETWAYAKWDDDDIYMPWHLESLEKAFREGSWVQPRVVLELRNEGLFKVETFNREKPTKFGYHGSWGYTRELFKKIRGYGAVYASDDFELQRRLHSLNRKSVDIPVSYPPGYIYNRVDQHPRLGSEGGEEPNYWNMERLCDIKYVGLIPKWEDDSIWNFSMPKETIERGW